MQFGFMSGKVKVRTTVRTKQGNSEEFEVNVAVQQGSVLSPLLFVAVMEVVTRKVRGLTMGTTVCR